MPGIPKKIKGVLERQKGFLERDEKHDITEDFNRWYRAIAGVFYEQPEWERLSKLRQAASVYDKETFERVMAEYGAISIAYFREVERQKRKKTKKSTC